MFTGIIQGLGEIEDIDFNNSSYLIKTSLNLSDCKIGSSICCDGVCLTATKIKSIKSDYFFEADIGEETIKRSNLCNWNLGTKINIEKSLKVGDEISGHFVYGHVDATLDVKKINKLKNSWEYEFSLDNLDSFINIKRYIVEKGSIAINGISLTVANVFESSFNISIITHTYQNTNISALKENDKVNIEFDPLARYISERYGN